MTSDLLPLCVRIDADDARSANALWLNGWRQIEILEIYRRRIDAKLPINNSPAEDLDVYRCAAIWEAAAGHNRLHNDSKVPRKTADAARRKSVIDAFERARKHPDKTVILAARRNDMVAGFIAIDISPPEARIDMLAVQDVHQRAGMATGLIADAMSAAAKGGAEFILAGTQRENIQARKFYMANGFQLWRTQKTFHK